MGLQLYIARRLLLMIPTFLGITVLSFGVMQLAPGGPVESYLANLKFSGAGEGGAGASGRTGGTGRENSVVTQEVLEEIKRKYGFDKPIHERYILWLKNLATFDFGYSHTFGRPVMDVIKSKLPVSIQFGVATFIIIYSVCIPLGIYKAVRDGSRFDVGTSFLVFFLYSIPELMLAILLIVLFAGGRYFGYFPLGGLESIDAETFTLFERIKDRVWHATLPLICMCIGGFATLTLLMKNSVIEEVRKDYVRTAQAKGLSYRQAIFKHALRNALIPIATGLGGFLGVFFTSNLILEKIFNLDGFGRLFYEAALQRDYPVLMASVVLSSIIILTGQLISDLLYVLIDPRIDFN